MTSGTGAAAGVGDDAVPEALAVADLYRSEDQVFEISTRGIRFGQKKFKKKERIIME